MNFLLAKKKIIIIISAILALISLAAGLTTLSISSQKQLNRLQQFPDHLQEVISSSLHGVTSPYYKVFLASLDAGYLVDSTGTLSMNGVLVLADIQAYHNKQPLPTKTWPTGLDQAATNGQKVWDKVKLTLANNHLTYSTNTGLGYFWQSLQHGTSFGKLLVTPPSQTNVIDTVLKELLTENNNVAAYTSVHAVNELAKSNNPPLPNPPATIVVSTPDITGIKAGAILLVIVTPILLFFSISISGAYLIYNYKTSIINNWNKVLSKVSKQVTKIKNKLAPQSKNEVESETN